MPRLHELLRLPNFTYTDRDEVTKPPAGMVKSSAYLGVEFEFEGTKYYPHDLLMKPDHKDLAKWYTVHEDGSLRGRDAAELVFHTPLKAPHARSAMDTLLERARTHEWQVNRRTGFHVHLNVGDLEEQEFLNLLRLYALYEAAIFTAAGDGRSGSIFCIPWFRDVYLAERVAEIAQGGPFYQYARNFGKYSGLNLKPITSFGSVEFRHLRNTTDTARIHDWVNLILLLHKHACSKSFDNWWATAINGNAKQALFEVYQAENLRPWAALDYPDFQLEVNRLTKDVALHISQVIEETAKNRDKGAKEVKPGKLDPFPAAPNARGRRRIRRAGGEADGRNQVDGDGAGRERQGPVRVMDTRGIEWDVARLPIDDWERIANVPQFVDRETLRRFVNIPEHAWSWVRFNIGPDTFYGVMN